MTIQLWRLGPEEYPKIPLAQQNSIITWLQKRRIKYEETALVLWDEPGGIVIVKEWMLNEKGEHYGSAGNPDEAAHTIHTYQERPIFSGVFRKYGTLVDEKELGISGQA